MTGPENLIHAFPNTLKKNVETVIDLLPVEHEILSHDHQTHIVDFLISPESAQVVLNGESLAIPIRVYFNECDTATLSKLSDVEKDILRCIYLSHHDGHVRQKYLKALDHSTRYFIIPFIFRLLGDYVIEILEVLNDHINANTIHHYTSFIQENPTYWQQIQSRVTSYWNEFYRQEFPDLEDYIGKKIVNKLQHALSAQ